MQQSHQTILGKNNGELQEAITKNNGKLPEAITKKCTAQ